MIYKFSIHTVKESVKKIVLYHKIHFWLQRYFSVACHNNIIAVQLDFWVLSPTLGPERSVGKLRRTNPYQPRMSVCTRPRLVLKTPGMPMKSEPVEFPSCAVENTLQAHVPYYLAPQHHSSNGRYKITANGDCSHEIKRCLLLGRKVMTNLDNILKSRDITLPTEVHLAKVIVFPVVMDVRVGL